MTPKQRLLAVLAGEIPDRVPATPDVSNMIPARLTGKPFWDIYLYKDPPLWLAYIDCVKHFGIDAMLNGFPLTFQEETDAVDAWEECIVQRTEDRIVTRRSRLEDGKRLWKQVATAYRVADPPARNVPVEKLGMPETPPEWEPVEGVKPVDTGPEGLKQAKQAMGDQGLIGSQLAWSLALSNEEKIYEYYDNPDKHQIWADQRVEAVERRFERIMAMDTKPDYLCVGGSGTLVLQTVEIFRQLSLPAVKRGIELACEAGIPAHVHSCGPERELIKIMAEETNLTIIDPLEIPPMGDCDLAEMKRLYGHKLTLKGNLHTTNVMLRGTPDDVRRASVQALRAAGTGGRFILSTGDQCGRDTPDENLRAMIETVEEFGVYDRAGTLPNLPPPSENGAA